MGWDGAFARRANLRFLPTVAVQPNLRFALSYGRGWA